jgi:DNA replication and repair protein RecF
VRIAWIEARDFRNHRETSLEVPAGVVAVVGPNGHGKTNLLEAMHYLCSLESPRVRSDLPLVRIGAASAFLRGEVVTAGGRFLVEVEIRPSGANRVQVNRSPIRRKRDLRASVRSVFCGPDDLAIVQGEPDERRRFLDGAVRSLWPQREPAIVAYERALRQRNRLLKDWDGSGCPPGLPGWDAELVSAGAVLTWLRAGAMRLVAPEAAEAFRSITGDPADTLRAGYVPSVPNAAAPGMDVEAVSGAFAARLQERRADELIRRTTLVGPHRDDVDLVVEGLAARGFASHGEAWGAALALRSAQAAAVTREAGEPPVLFLDDPFSAFDPARRRRLAGELGGRGQVLLAVPDEAQVPGDAVVWRVKEGTVIGE